MAEQPKLPTNPNAELAAMRAELNELRELVKQQQMARITPDTLWAREQLKQAAIEGALTGIAAYATMTTKQRSQYEANKLPTEAKRIFRVLLGTGNDGDSPELLIRAETPSDAKARYQDVCGITAVRPEPTHPEWSRWTVTEATNDPEAQAAVRETWQYNPSNAA